MGGGCSDCNMSKLSRSSPSIPPLSAFRGIPIAKPAFPPYRYDGLPPESGHGVPPQIRIMELLPTLEGVQCFLHHAYLVPELKFVAVSYAWGEGLPDVPILCNYQRMEVTGELFRCLNEISRAIQTPTLLWIDQVCIDQRNVDEKSRQVSLMLDIYRAATEVIVWLEDLNWNLFGSPTLALLQRLAEFSRTPAGEQSRRDMAQGDILKVVRAYHDAGLGDVDSRALKGFLRLLSCPWHSRTWVVQEVVVARKITVCGRGSFKVDWKTFVDAAALVFQGSLSLLGGSVGSIQYAQQQLSLTQWLRKDSNLPLLRLLMSARAFKAKDPKDKVFALYGLSKEGKDLQIPIDYRHSLARVYGGIALAILKRDRCLDFLSVPRKDSGLLPPLPSWIPDWREPSGALLSLGLGGPVGGSGLEFCEFRSSRSSLARPQTYDEDGLLKIETLCFDSILTLCEVLNPDLRTEDLSKILNSDAYNEVDILGEHHTMDTWMASATQGAKLEPKSENDTEIFYQVVSAGRSKKEDGQDRIMWKHWVILGRWKRWIVKCCQHLPFQKVMIQKLHLSLYKLAAHTGNWLDISDFITRVILPSTGRRLGRSARNYLALLPKDAEVGDKIFLAKGSKTPLLLRPAEDRPGLWTFVGDCYVHGIMYGEAFDETQCSETLLI